MNLLAQDATGWLTDFVATQGLAVAIVLAMILFAWKYVPKVIDKSIQVAEGVLASLGLLTEAVQENTEQTKAVQLTATAMAENLMAKLDPKGKPYSNHVFSTTGTNAALLQLSHIVREGLDHIEDDGMDPSRRLRIQTHLHEIERLLKSE